MEAQRDAVEIQQEHLDMPEWPRGSVRGIDLAWSVTVMLGSLESQNFISLHQS